MVILHYLPDLDQSSAGVLSYIQTFATMMHGEAELHILTSHTPDEVKLCANCHVHFLSRRYMPRRSTKKEFLKILNDIKPDVFHANVCWIPLCALTAIWAKEAGYKVVYTTHGMMEPWIMRRHYLTKKLPALLLFQRKALRMADMIHATSEGEKHNLLRLGYNNNITVIPNCIDISGIRIKDNWQRKNRILYLGRLHKKKGIGYLLESFSLVTSSDDSNNSLILDIAGESDVNTPGYREELEALVRAKGLEGRVNFVGGVYGEEKYELMRQADLFVLPTHSENFGIVVAEALACGTPVITTKGTPWQELESEHCGWWTEIGTEPLVEALRNFATLSEAELEQMGRNGRRLIESHYDSNAIAQQFVALYEKMTNKNTQHMKHVRLSTFNGDNFDKGASLIKRTLWYFVNAWFVRASWNPFAAPKIFLLRLFGAKIGKGLVMKNDVIIKSPWYIEIGDNVWLGEKVWIDNLDRVTIGCDVCLSQGALILTGNHDYKSTSFDYRNAPITIEDGAWIGAGSTVCAGITVHTHALLTVGSVATKDLEPWGIFQGNPAVKVRERVIEK